MQLVPVLEIYLLQLCLPLVSKDALLFQKASAVGSYILFSCELLEVMGHLISFDTLSKVKTVHCCYFSFSLVSDNIN